MQETTNAGNYKLYKTLKGMVLIFLSHSFKEYFNI